MRGVLTVSESSEKAPESPCAREPERDILRKRSPVRVCLSYCVCLSPTPERERAPSPPWSPPIICGSLNPLNIEVPSGTCGQSACQQWGLLYKFFVLAGTVSPHLGPHDPITHVSTRTTVNDATLSPNELLRSAILRSKIAQCRHYPSKLTAQAGGPSTSNLTPPMCSTHVAQVIGQRFPHMLK